MSLRPTHVDVRAFRDVASYAFAEPRGRTRHRVVRPPAGHRPHAPVTAALSAAHDSPHQSGITFVRGISQLRAMYPGLTPGELVLQMSSEGHAKGLQALLVAHSPTETRLYNGQTPLMLAVMAQSEPCVALLLAARADVNAHDEAGTTALHLAAALGCMPIVARLCQTTAIVLDAPLHTPEGETPCAMAEAAQKLCAAAYLRVQMTLRPDC